jgi:ABC-type glycerol-3-phosphate transport system substrate-binding protein
MPGMTRRSLLGASVLAAVGAATGCSSSSSTSNTSSGATGTLDWWDHFSSFKHLNDDWARKKSGPL